MVRNSSENREKIMVNQRDQKVSTLIETSEADLTHINVPVSSLHKSLILLASYNFKLYKGKTFK